MAISTDYPRPIMVNGYVCRNCDDVSDAKKFIDPSKPKTGPEAVAETKGLSAGTEPVSQTDPAANDPEPAVRFGGALAFRNAAPDAVSAPDKAWTGQSYDKVA